MGRGHQLVGVWSEHHAFVLRKFTLWKLLLKSLDTFSQKFAPAKSSRYTLSGEIPYGIVRNESDVASEERLVAKLDFHSHVKHIGFTDIKNRPEEVLDIQRECIFISAMVHLPYRWKSWTNVGKCWFNGKKLSVFLYTPDLTSKLYNILNAAFLETFPLQHHNHNSVTTLNTQNN